MYLFVRPMGLCLLSLGLCLPKQCAGFVKRLLWLLFAVASLYFILYIIALKSLKIEAINQAEYDGNFVLTLELTNRFIIPTQINKISFINEDGEEQSDLNEEFPIYLGAYDSKVIDLEYPIEMYNEVIIAIETMHREIIVNTKL
ncbi:hypothetical protein ECANGB1_611 [Enterospora canceri]|uniref:Uncharacterized protein n=1 Tax=Enterospora canceri TaxID=1081671 RepID=A0A1Y1S7W2_9MICR|nr:hypothetical protein ECANGB1_611 [Enterospora canceri]